MNEKLLMIISPAKTMNLSISSIKKYSIPIYLNQTEKLVNEIKQLSKVQLKKHLKISDHLATLNYERYQNFIMSSKQENFPNKNFKQAGLMYDGPAYLGLRLNEMSLDELEYAQKYLRILSGLYGSLRPLDMIQPYRLEMSQKLNDTNIKNLYLYWKDSITDDIISCINEQNNNSRESEKGILVNLASKEYFDCIDIDKLKKMNITIIDFIFKDDNKIKSVYTKKARGLMCRYIIRNKITSDYQKKIKRFTEDGYEFSSKESSESVYVFKRNSNHLKNVKTPSTSKNSKKRKII